MSAGPIGCGRRRRWGFSHALSLHPARTRRHRFALVRLCRLAVGAAATKLLAYDKARNPKTGKLVALPGLTKRRQAERALFEGGG